MNHIVRPVGVGAPLSLTGPFSVQGKQARAGIELWAEEVTRAGGISLPPDGKKAPLRLLILDDKSHQEEVIHLTERLICEEGVELLLGPYSSALALAPVAERFRIPIWNHGGAADILYERGFRFLVGVAPPASTYFRGLFEWMREAGVASSRVALVHAARGSFPAAVAEGALRWAEETGSRIFFQGTYPFSSEGFDPLVGDIQDLHPEFLLGVGQFEEDLAFARALRRASVAPRAVVLVAAGVSAFGENLGEDAEGFWGPSQWEGGEKHLPNRGLSSAEFARRLRARFGAQADYPAAQAYAACVIAAGCLSRVGRGDSERLRDAANSFQFTTLFGPFQIEPATGRPLRPRAPLLVQWQGKRRVIVWSPAGGTVRPDLPFLR